MSTPATPTGGLRADAVRSRELLLRAAREVLAAEGTEASVADIAVRAGLGKGTVFRHYPTKDDLIAAVVGDVLDTLLAKGIGLLDTTDPAAALYEFMADAIDLQARDRAFCEVVARTSQQHPRVQAAVGRLHDLVERLTERARTEGAIRDDVTGTDIALLLSGVYQTAAPLAATQPELWRRYLALALDGLQPGTARPLPHPPPRPQAS
jgi:AcrR family transcriptional regulator